MTDYTDADLIRWYVEDGMTMKECGDRVGVSRERVRQRLKRNGVTGGVRPLTDQEESYICERYESSDLTMTAVAEEIGRSETSVARALEKNGITVEDRRDYTVCRISKDKERRIVELYRAGASYTEICRTLHTYGGAIRRALTERSVPIRHQKVTPDEVERMCQLREQGLTLAQVADRLGRSSQCVWQRTSRNGDSP